MTLNTFIVLQLILFVVLVTGIQNKYCQLPCDYISEVFTHTVCIRGEEKCGPHEKCGTDFKMISLSDNYRQDILNLHNYLRNQVAIGNETRGEQPPAANMKILTYNKELEFMAQCWANTCNGNPLIHDNCRRTSSFEHVGQNLGFINSSLPDINIHKSTRELIMLWYDEVSLFKNHWINETMDRGPDIKVGHYTQMIWADTSEIGCAVSFYTTVSFNATWNHIIFVCNYGPGGNYLGLPVYEIGEPSSMCPGDTEPNEEYFGLCGNSTRIVKDNNTFNIFEVI